MPEMDGIETLKKIRQNPKTANLPVLIITANPEKKAEALASGANDFLAKPYDVLELKLRTLNYAKLKHAMDEVNQQNEILEERVKERTQSLNKALIQAKKQNTKSLFV